MEAHDYFLMALAFLSVTGIMLLAEIWGFPAVIVGITVGRDVSPVVLNFGWVLLILLFLFFLVFLLAGALKFFFFSPLPADTES